LIETTAIEGDYNNAANMKIWSDYGKLDLLSNDTVVNKNGLINRVATQFMVPKIVLNIPEGFSPNNDGINDFFIIVKPYNIKIDIEIYNRSGKIVYSKKNYTNNWNGKGNGNYSERDLDDDGYYYSIKATDESGRVQVFKGFVLIQR
jgi:hypothetical protein